METESPACVDGGCVETQNHRVFYFRIRNVGFDEGHPPSLRTYTPKEMELVRSRMRDVTHLRDVAVSVEFNTSDITPSGAELYDYIPVYCVHGREQ